MIIIMIFCIIEKLNKVLAKKYQRTSEIEKIIEGYLPDDLDPIETQIFAQKIEKLAKRFDIDKNKKNKIVKAAQANNTVQTNQLQSNTLNGLIKNSSY